jgi:hypothetical protein
MRVAVREVRAAVDRLDDPLVRRRLVGPAFSPSRSRISCSGNAAPIVATMALRASSPAELAMSRCSFENVGSRLRSRAASTTTDAARRAARTATARTGSPIMGTSGITGSRR